MERVDVGLLAPPSQWLCPSPTFYRAGSTFFATTSASFPTFSLLKGLLSSYEPVFDTTTFEVPFSGLT